MANGGEIKPSEQELRIARARRVKLVKLAIWLAVAGLLAAGGSWVLLRLGRGSGTSGPGQFIADQGRDHVPLGTKFDYNSNPPTSGPHFAAPEEWGVYDKEIDDQILIHNLEHGGIWISYKPGIDAALKGELEAIAKDYGRKVIITPRQANDSDIALAAWNHLDKFSAGEFSGKRVRDFVKAYRNKGPEFVP